MTKVITTQDRRSFLKVSAAAGGGILIGFNWLLGCTPSAEQVKSMPEEWYNINGFLKIGDNGLVTIMSPNPEIGQNVKTSMPMLVAEELDVDWKDVMVEQAPLNTDIFTRQLAGGSQSIRQSWESLRTTGATARQMLILAAAKTWDVPPEEITTENGKLVHSGSGKEAGYGEMASAAVDIPVPDNVPLKEKKEFKIIGTSRKNVDGHKIVTGQPLYGIDTYEEGMLVAMIIHPPAFGMSLKSIDASEAKNMAGIKDVFTFETFGSDEKRGSFDISAFPHLIAVVGESTWQVMQAKKAVKAEWEKTGDQTVPFHRSGREWSVNFPAGLESTEMYMQKMKDRDAQGGETVREDGNPRENFDKATKILERTYTAPHLAHNCMEPMNFFAHVTSDKAILKGPIQTPEFLEETASDRLGLPLEKIDIQMTRMGGGFGRRLYGNFLIEAAIISKKVNAPIKLIYTREDDMTAGTYRPAYLATYRAGLDADNNITAFQVRMGGMSESPLFANRFPAGALDHYLAENWSIDTNITHGAFRAPRSNFSAGVEQAFLDELAEEAGKDPIDLRLELFEKAKNQPVGENNDYDAERYAGVIKLVREMSNWDTPPENVHRGMAAYYCHNSYVANVVDLVMDGNKPVIEKVYCAVDCGIVVNPDAATNMIEGGTIDGIGHALYSELTFIDGVPQQKNFDKYKLIRHSEAPKSIEVQFVKNDIDPTGLGEPPYPPVIGALANALYKATGKRIYDQPFIKHLS
ncbi:xanthine dehydrogenase family protein molybdopterin-binding subunit [Membranihabitans maritimus]|uniref:xanthine dehydrogenase family protein molybdopterin-binding subunit n=1 Tax=Membranihabitans maritimus TaxID=2904244 RepID=UPI001F31659B|nr:molybdopterin cofactor-binding domain-containing protein [Membranihabitans maritimus]